MFFVIKKAKYENTVVMKRTKRILSIVGAACLACALAAYGGYLCATSGIHLDESRLQARQQNIILYDGKDVAQPLYSSKTETKISALPHHVKRAFIDVEDRRFYRHGGFDTRSILRAVWRNAKARKVKEGASTISQQLIKNTHLSQKKTMKRKLQEWKLTRQLERKFSKDEILERYLNVIYFGHDCFGIASAAEFYFGKAPAELSVAEAATLAGLVKSPNRYSPYKNPENCQKRRACVLSLMQKSGSISAEEKRLALAEPLPNPQPRAKCRYAHFALDELTDLADKQGLRLGGKVEIYTYLDADLQAKMEELYAETTRKTAKNGCDEAFCCLDTETDGFVGCVSDIGNRPRLTGSVLKPLLVYAPALEENLISPATPILDEKVNYGGYAPANYDGKYHGYVSARECLEQSYNLPAVKILASLGVKKGREYLQKLGLNTTEKDNSLALALGGMEKGFSLPELVGAYSVFPSGGEKQPCGFIRRITINEKTVYEKPCKKQRVFGEDTAYLTTDMLCGAAKTGTAKKLRDLPFAVAAKTGTAGAKSGNTDAYTVAYTKKYCCGAWLGNADNQKITHTGGSLPCNLVKEMLAYLHQKAQTEGNAEADFPERFTMPHSVTRVQIDKTAYYDTHTIQLADDNAPAAYRFAEIFKKSQIPRQKCTIFSNPSCSAPTLRVENGKVVLAFYGHFPAFYTYKIEKENYATHNLLYVGEYLESFTDEDLKAGERYAYTITPMYNGKAGESVRLPTVCISENGTAIEDKHILDLPWWEG